MPQNLLLLLFVLAAAVCLVSQVAVIRAVLTGRAPGVSRRAAGRWAEIAWVILGQAAKAARDAELVTTAEQGLEEAERRWKWLRTKLKESSPQVLVAG